MKSGEGVAIVRSSVDGDIFSLDIYHVFLEGDIRRDFFFGDCILLCFHLNIRAFLEVDAICR